MSTDRQIETVKRYLRKRAASTNKSSLQNIADQGKVELAVVQQLFDEFEEMCNTASADVIAEAKGLIENRESVSKIVKQTGLDEYVINTLEHQYQHSPLEGEERAQAEEMLLSGQSPTEIVRATKYNRNKLDALIIVMQGETIDKAMGLIRDRGSDREVAAQTGLSEATINWLARERYDVQPLPADDANAARQMLLDGQTVSAIVKKCEFRVSHGHLEGMFGELQGEAVDKIKELVADTHPMDIHKAIDQSLDYGIVTYWIEQIKGDAKANNKIPQK